MKRLITIFILFLLIAGNILLFASPIVKAGVKVSPSKLVIRMPEGYPTKEIQYKIKVTNPYSEDIRAESKVINPYELTEGLTRIPDKSWVQIIPETLDIPANSFKEFEVVINIPEGEKTLHYNESWEVWALITPKRSSAKGGAVIQIQMAVKLLVHTPTGEMTVQRSQEEDTYLILGIIIGVIAVPTTYFYIRKKRNARANRGAIYYVKKRKRSKKDIR